VLFAALWLTGPVLAAEVPTPSQIYGELFERVQLERVYPDSKTFVDALPKQPPEVILEEYRRARERPGFDLAAFVKAHFEPTAAHIPPYHTIAGQDVRDHIDRLWSVLERKPDDQRPYSSRLALPHRYIVPGASDSEPSIQNAYSRLS
jgi:alpha,alpha-trehalase